jgi:hypothetical protein
MEDNIKKNSQEILGKEWFDLAQNREGVAGFWEYGAERTCL